jgi:hypothetical protein
MAKARSGHEPAATSRALRSLERIPARGAEPARRRRTAAGAGRRVSRHDANVRRGGKLTKGVGGAHPGGELNAELRHDLAFQNEATDAHRAGTRRGR